MEELKEPFDKNLLVWDSSMKCWHPVKKWEIYFQSHKEQIKYLKKQYPNMSWTVQGRQV